MSGNVIIIDNKYNKRFKFIEHPETREVECEIEDTQTGKKYNGEITSISSNGKFVIEVKDEISN